MKRYSFISESDAIGKILSVSGMTALGSSGGSYVGNNLGNLIGRYKYKKIDPDSISWSDPDFLNIVRNSLYQAKNNVKISKEWYSSCDESDKKTARKDYLDAIEKYKEIQRDISERNPFRWISDYKKLKIEKTADKYQNIGRTAGAIAGGGGAGLAILKYK